MSSSLATAHNQVSFKVFGFLLNLAHCILCVAMLPFFRFAIVTIVGIVLALDPAKYWSDFHQQISNMTRDQHLEAIHCSGYIQMWPSPRFIFDTPGFYQKVLVHCLYAPISLIWSRKQKNLLHFIKSVGKCWKYWQLLQ